MTATPGQPQDNDQRSRVSWHWTSDGDEWVEVAGERVDDPKTIKAAKEQ